jgi:hypothetical protein
MVHLHTAHDYVYARTRTYIRESARRLLVHASLCREILLLCFGIETSINRIENRLRDQIAIRSKLSASCSCVIREDSGDFGLKFFPECTIRFGNPCYNRTLFTGLLSLPDIPSKRRVALAIVMAQRDHSSQMHRAGVARHRDETGQAPVYNKKFEPDFFFIVSMTSPERSPLLQSVLLLSLYAP